MRKEIKNPFHKLWKKCTLGTMESKAGKIPGFPRLIDIEITNHCNFHCVMCPTGEGLIKRPTGNMSDKTLDKILFDTARYKTPIRLIRWGEPLMHPHWKAVLCIIKAAGRMCHINTNGSLLKDEDLRFLINSGLDSIKFSFQGADPKGYAFMRRNDCYLELVGKIRKLHALRGSKTHPFIQVGTTLTNESDSLIEAFMDEMKPITDAVYIGKTRDLSQQNPISAQCECPEVFDKLSVDWDGKVTACCGDYDRYMTIGDISESSLLMLWHCDKLKHFRDLLLHHRHNELYLCGRCARSEV